MTRSKQTAQFLKEQREAKEKVTGINSKSYLPSRNEVANAEGPKGSDVNKKDQKEDILAISIQMLVPGIFPGIFPGIVPKIVPKLSQKL